MEMMPIMNATKAASVSAHCSFILIFL